MLKTDKLFKSTLLKNETAFLMCFFWKPLIGSVKQKTVFIVHNGNVIKLTHTTGFWHSSFAQ